MEFEHASPALFFALHVYHPSMLSDVFDKWRVDWSEKFQTAASGGSSPFSNVHDNTGRGIPLAVQFIIVGLPSRTVWFLGWTSTTGKANSKIKYSN